MKVTRCIEALLFLYRELESDKISSSLCLRPQACRSHHTAFFHCPIYVRCHVHLRIQKSAKCLDSYGQISECSVVVAHSSKRNYDVPSPLSADASNGNVQFVGKTIESFKLADLYWLDSRVMAFCNQKEKKRNKGVYAASEVRKLAFHRPTASYLLGYLTSSNGEKCDKVKKLPFLPFRSHRFQYVAEVVASGRTPEEFINNVELETQINRDQFPKLWTLDHDIFEPYQDPVHHKRNFTSNMLICSLSRVLPPEPALTFQEKFGEILPYVIIETSSRFYLGQKISRNDLTQLSEKKITGKEFRSSWSQRPFPYSGAINLDIAFVVIEILKDLVGVNSRAIPLHREGCKVTNRRLRIIDPTCGSGTFLGVALMVWGDEQNVDLEVVGVDSNPKCSLGTARNLKTMFLQEDSPMKEDGKDIRELNVTSSVKATVYTGDSTDLISLFGEEKFDCGVANLPWNRNTYEFRNEDNDSDESNTNYKILEAVRSILKTGAPLVVISGERKNDNPYFDTRQCLIDMGFDVIGQVSVPPAGFSLPKSEKKNTNRDREQGKFCEVSTRRSDCVITVATVPSTSND